MGVVDGVCDYCGRDRLLETGDEQSKLQRNKLWCGTCRAGSLDRYRSYSDENLQGQIDIYKAMLEQHPLRYEEPYDHFRMNLFKLDCQDEMWRMNKELEWRRED